MVSSLRAVKLDQLSRPQWSPSLRFWGTKTTLRISQTAPLYMTWTMSTHEECALLSPLKETVRLYQDLISRLFFTVVFLYCFMPLLTWNGCIYSCFLCRSVHHPLWLAMSKGALSLPDLPDQPPRPPQHWRHDAHGPAAADCCTRVSTLH